MTIDDPLSSSRRTRTTGVGGPSDAPVALDLDAGVSPKQHRHGWFRSFAEAAASWFGRPTAFVSAVALVVVWAAVGPYFRFSESWQMVINTGTTIITFLMVFLLQSSQTRDSRAIHLKLNELVRAVEQARNTLVAVESLSDDHLDALHSEFVALSADERSVEAERTSALEGS